MRCTRRPGSLWTACRCPDCRAYSARMAKRHRNGWRPPDQRLRAIARLRVWLRAGYSVGAVASMTGLSAKGVAPLMRALRGDQHMPRMTHRTVDAILSAREPRSGFVPSVGAMRRMQALACLGWGVGSLSAHSGVSAATLEDVRKGNAPRARAATVAIIAQMYEELSMTPGPSERAAREARAKGWAPPLLWDDEWLDDPNGRPEDNTPAPGRVDLPRLLEAIAKGTTDVAMAEEFGVATDAVYRNLSRHGHWDAYDRLLAWSGRQAQPKQRKSA
jgi:hypothetical protein